MNEEVGAFTSDAHDAIKHEMSKKTGIMSSLYNTNKSYIQLKSQLAASSSSQNEMSKDLCLEINSKLQGLLEDTLVKNITLKVDLVSIFFSKLKYDFNSKICFLIFLG
jgi:hypothetical protein